MTGDGSRRAPASSPEPSTAQGLADAMRTAEAALLHEKDALIERQAALRRESEHRLLNGLQIVASLLSMHSRATASPEAAAALAIAVERVSTIGRIHRRLHSNDGAESVAFKEFVEALCQDFAAMLPAPDSARRTIAVEGDELLLRAGVAIPLGFVVSELITNALKYGDGPIKVRLAPDHRKGCALSVENAGQALPEDFDPAQSKGLGMRIIQSFVDAIGGELCVGRGESDQGARFTALFSPS